MNPDVINALFELTGAILLSLNVYILYKDKVVKGVHWLPTSFFVSWGVWNLYFYPHLGQWYSFAAGVLLVVVNIIWLCMMFYYGTGGKYESTK